MTAERAKSERTDQSRLSAMLASFAELRFAVLATSDEGRPYTSLVAFCFSPDCRTLLFATTRDTKKYRNLLNQPAVSVLIDNRSQSATDLEKAQAVTLLGSARELKSAGERKEHRIAFVGRHPELETFVDSRETALFAVTIEQALHVSHFQDVSRWP